MRPSLLLGLALIGSLGLGACQGQDADVVDEAATETRLSLAELRQMLEDADDERVMVVAHRACWRLAPENSLQEKRVPRSTIRTWPIRMPIGDI